VSRGLSKIQRHIVGILSGTTRPLVFRSGGTLTTGELLDELREAGLVREDGPRGVGTFTVRRACLSLHRRGLIRGVYTRLCDLPLSLTIAWRAARPDA
jgi:hypothetical protein